LETLLTSAEKAGDTNVYISMQHGVLV